MAVFAVAFMLIACNIFHRIGCPFVTVLIGGGFATLIGVAICVWVTTLGNDLSLIPLAVCAMSTTIALVLSRIPMLITALLIKRRFKKIWGKRGIMREVG